MKLEACRKIGCLTKDYSDALFSDARVFSDARFPPFSLYRQMAMATMQALDDDAPRLDDDDLNLLAACACNLDGDDFDFSDGALGGKVDAGSPTDSPTDYIDPLYALEGSLELGTIEEVNAAVAAVGGCDDFLPGAVDDDYPSRPFECSVVSKNPFAVKQPVVAPVAVAVKQPVVAPFAVKQPVVAPVAVKQPVVAPVAVKQPVVAPVAPAKEVTGGKRKLCELRFADCPNNKIKYRTVRWQFARASLGADDTEFTQESVRELVSLVAQFTRAEDEMLKGNGVEPPSFAHVYSKSLLQASRVKGVVQSLHPRFEKLQTEEVLGQNAIGNLANTVKKKGGFHGLRYDKTKGTRRQRSLGYFYES